MTNSHAQAARLFVISHRSFVIGHFELRPGLEALDLRSLSGARLADLCTPTPMTCSGDCPSYRPKAGQSYEAKVLVATTSVLDEKVWARRAKARLKLG